MSRTIPLGVLMATALLAGCGGGDSSAAAGNSVVAALHHNAAPANACPNGGAQLDTGVDANNNGVLDGSEITSTQYICNGAEGLVTLVAITDETAGVHCAAGGKRVIAGHDANGDGVLQDAEAASTGYVCNGSAGAAGANGITSLIKLTSESAGANCPTGGTKMESGPDSNRSGTLDAAEVTSSSYVCSAPQHASFTWVEARGEVRAEPNTGYLATGDRLVTVVLPASPAFGDVMRVSGVGAGGWRIVQNDGQSVYTPLTAGVLWTPRASPNDWRAVASSADGTKLAAVSAYSESIGGSGHIHISGDGGAHWTASELVGPWSTVASSTDGVRLIAGDERGHLFISTDAGANWTENQLTANQPWRAVASSADGRRLLAAADYNRLYLSTDGGATWTPREAARGWTTVASSPDGMRLIAATDTSGTPDRPGGQGEGQIYTSTNGGETWTAHPMVGWWKSVALSADGRRLIAGQVDGPVVTSNDGGATWRTHEFAALSVASSADGTRLIAAGEYMNSSGDGGETWTAHGAPRIWWGVASSADGTRFLGFEEGGLLYTSEPSNTTTPGREGGIIGHQYDAIELQYIGKDTFIILSSSGAYVVQ